MTRNLKLRDIGLWLAVALLAMLLGGCGRPPEPPWQSGELVVLTRNSPTTFYYDADDQPAGFEHDLVKRFADAQGWRVRFELVDSLDEMFERLGEGEAHLAAAWLTATDKRLGRLRFGPAYADEREVVVCGPDARLPRGPADLVGLRLEVVAGSSHVDRLREVHLEHPGISWEEVETVSEDDLLERVAAGLVDCTVSDETGFRVARNFLPGLQKSIDLGRDRRVAWAFPKRGESRLLEEVGRFFQEMEQSGFLETLRERHFGHIQRLAEADVLGILNKRGTELPELKVYFFRGQLLSGLDWRLLAAVAYQESQWDASAVSPTGVRGIMMLTSDTADRLGVKNRLDPEESILGGARYLRMLKEGLAEGIPDPDRTWLALAAYNIGPGHLEDARRLARKLGRDPDAWKDMKDVLPLIARSRYASQLRYGYARGGEARAFAENVRIYYDILARYERPYRDRIGFGVTSDTPLGAGTILAP